VGGSFLRGGGGGDLNTPNPPSVRHWFLPHRERRDLMKDTWLMQYEETGPICCKNHTDHTSTMCGRNTRAVRKVSSHVEYFENRSRVLRIQ